MTLSEFIAKWNGKGIDFDQVYGDQCMDLMHQYIVEVCGLPDGRILAAPAAKDVYLGTPFGLEHFDKIDNTPTGVPQPGDIVFWGPKIGPYGHVAIFKEGDANKFTSFDQNWNGHSFCELVTHNYTGVLGWLRPKVIPPPVTDQATVDQLRTDRDKNWNLYQEELKKVGELQVENAGLRTQIQQVNLDNANLHTQMADLEKRDATAIDAGLKAERELADFKVYIDTIAEAMGVEVVNSDYKSAVKSILDVYTAISKPSTQVVKEHQKLGEALFDIIGRAKIKTFTDWLSYGFNMLKGKLGL